MLHPADAAASADAQPVQGGAAAATPAEPMDTGEALLQPPMYCEVGGWLLTASLCVLVTESCLVPRVPGC